MQASVRDFVIRALNTQAGRDPAAEASLAQKFSETGLDSLDLMELLNEVEEQFDIRVNDDTITAETTVGDFIAFVAAKVSKAGS
jgi:acyl carrier protein